MIKILIVDDEYIILESLENLIDWQSIGAEVSGTADNGAAALDFTLKHHPDIILSDISMPFFSGLEMLQTLRKNHLDTEVIFISAHSKFEYAREALQHGAFDYILKPLNEQILLDTVRRCTEKIKNKMEGGGDVWAHSLTAGESLYFDPHTQTLVDKAAQNGPDYRHEPAANMSFQTAEHDLLQSVKTGDDAAVKERLLTVLTVLIQELDIFDADLIRLTCVELLDYILRGLEDLHLQEYLGNPLKVLHIKKTITASESFDAMVEVTQNILVNITLCVKEILADNSKKLVSQAVTYIQENYQKDISLSQIAGHLYISPAYLSRIFSTEMELPFSRYLRNCRIENAKKLLRENRLKIYEVATQVGYSDVAHFSKSFKQITGVTPIDYREERIDILYTSER